MVFFLIFLVSVLYCNIIDRLNDYNTIITKNNWFPLEYIPLALFWTFICSVQYKVGTDYSSYIKIFNGENLDYYSNNGEILFSTMIRCCNAIGWRGQIIYVLIYSICFFCFFLTLGKCNIRHSAIFILLYIAVSTVFNNQFNIVRQSLAVYIGTYAVILIMKNRVIRPICLIIIASMIHITAISFVIFFIPKKIFLCCTKNILKLLLIISLILSIALSVTIFNSVLDYLPKTYSWYILSDDLGEMSLISSLTKYLFFPLYWLAISKYSIYKLNHFERLLFICGIISFAIRIAINNLPLINRLSFSFLVLSMFPLYYYLEYLLLKKSKLFPIIVSIIFMFYALKVIIYPAGEYIYQSIIFL